jgi:hypothetical protein
MVAESVLELLVELAVLAMGFALVPARPWLFAAV